MKMLIAYDGSPDARAAVSLAGHLFDGSTAIVLTVWEGFSTVVARAEAGLSSSLEFERIEAECRQHAEDLAADGAGHARAAGLQAAAGAVEQRGSIAETILREAEASDVELIVVGTRGLSGVKSFLLGSVSRAVLQRARLPVLVAPTPAQGGDRAPLDEPFLSARL
jgi:nucleotide-binding universal stress UspA family protein